MFPEALPPRSEGLGCGGPAALVSEVAGGAHGHRAAWEMPGACFTEWECATQLFLREDEFCFLQRILVHSGQKRSKAASSPWG